MKTVRLWVLGLLLGVAMQAQAGNTADGMDTWFGTVNNTDDMLISTYPKNGGRGGMDVTDNADRHGSIPYGTNNQFNNFYSPDYTNVGLRPPLSTTVENRIVLKWPLNASPASIGLLCKGRSVLCFSFLW